MEAKLLERISEAVHEVTREFTIRINTSPHPPRWNELSPELKYVGRQMVLRALEGQGAFMLHSCWVQDMIDLGWTYGLKVDYVGLKHPHVVGFGSLPESERYRWALVIGLSEIFKRQWQAE